MTVIYILAAFFGIGIIVDTVKSLLKKDYDILLLILFLLPFFVFMISSILLGGSAFHDAASSYPSYQPGHFYLMSHGHYTEVSFSIYTYMRILEVVGIASFGIAFLLGIIHTFRIPED